MGGGCRCTLSDADQAGLTSRSVHPSFHPSVRLSVATWVVLLQLQTGDKTFSIKEETSVYLSPPPLSFSIARVRCLGLDDRQGVVATTATSTPSTITITPLALLAPPSHPPPPLIFPLISICLTSPLTDHSSVRSEWARCFRHPFSLCQANLQLPLFTSMFPVKVFSPHPPTPPPHQTPASAPATYSSLSFSNYGCEYLQLFFFFFFLGR